MSGIIYFLNYKYGIDENMICFEALEKIAELEGIPIKWIDSIGNNSGMICWGAHHRTHRPIIFLKGKNRELGKSKPGAYFSLGHELGHYFLHPYLKYMDLRHVSEMSEKEAEMLGICQLEADQFATRTLIPQSELFDKFEVQVIQDLLSGDWVKRISKTQIKIYQHCVQRTKSLLRTTNGNNDINEKSKKNLRIRTDAFIGKIREKIIIYYGRFPEDIHDKELDDDKIKEIKNTHKMYQEIY